MFYLAWHEKALCAEVSGDIFFPEAGGISKETSQAKAICERCPVKVECLEDALVGNVGYGIWGGLTPVERNALKKLRKKVDKR